MSIKKSILGGIATVTLLISAAVPALVAAEGTKPTLYTDCTKSHYINFVNDNDKTFPNQEACIDYVAGRSHEVRGDAFYNAYGLDRHAKFNMNTAAERGVFKYSDDNGQAYTVSIKTIEVKGHNAWFEGPVTDGNVGAGEWLFAKVNDFGQTPKIWGSFTDQATAENGVTNMSDPGDGPFDVTHGFIAITRPHAI